MATLPQATVTVDETSGAFAGGTGYIVVMACTTLNADFVPRIVSSTQGLLATYGYSPGVDYCALHFQKTRKPVMFIGMPIVTAGIVCSQDDSGVVGTSVVTASVGASGALDQAEFVVKVLDDGNAGAGGTVGTSSIKLSLSCDGGISTVNVLLGTASSYVIPQLGVTLNFGAGTLDVGDTFKFRTTAPMWGSTSINLARLALVGQQSLARTWLVIGDATNSTFAGYAVTEVNAYDTANQRYTLARVQVPDSRNALAGRIKAQTLTFDSVGHTVTRSAGSFISDGFAVGQSVTISGASQNGNNVTKTITALSATVMTFAAGMAAEGPTSASTYTIVQSQTLTQWVSAQSAAFATVDAQKRLSLGAGRGFLQSPITGWNFRRPAQWAASLREYTHDLQIPTWRKADGPLDGVSITDANGNTVEFDERQDGGALAARFTCLRSFGNGPLGAYVGLDLTRDSEGALLSRTHNMAVANLAETVVQAETENAIGQVLVLDSAGHGTPASLSKIEQRVNKALQVNLLQQFSEGQRASSAVWTASRTDILNVPGATLNGTLALQLNGTVENIATTIRIQSGG